MEQSLKKVLSVSRRTDIPAFYLDWFESGIARGCFDVKHPYTKKTKRIIVTPDTFHTIVFWSKNFAPLIEKKLPAKLLEMGFNLYFNFTVNSENSTLEPGLPPLELRLKQFEKLNEFISPDSVAWRFDPVCFYKDDGSGPETSNLTHFQTIASAAADAGIKKCVTSFYDPYTKIDRRLKKYRKANNTGLELIIPPLEKKRTIISNMACNLRQLGIDLHLCCEKKLFLALDPDTAVRQNACIDGRLFERQTGTSCVKKRDYGQRSKKGCQCTQSVDIGSYDDHPCYHNCIFCYANPSMDRTNPE